MDISSELIQTTNVLLKERLTDIKVYYTIEVVEDTKTYKTVISGFLNELKIVGSGHSTSPIKSYYKALVELGEDLIINKRIIQHSSGLAGGFLKSTAIERAKIEFIERDAFLYHYRSKTSFLNEVPLSTFSSNSRQNKFKIFQLSSACQNVYVYIAIDSEACRGNSKCLIFGLGSAINQIEAIQKAQYEYLSLFNKHKTNSNWCNNLSLDPQKNHNVIDTHHAFSRDQRNLDRLSHLCQIDSNNIKNRFIVSLDHKEWQLSELYSPVRFIRYIRAQHPKLVSLEFLKPEPDTSGPMLLHPFW